MAIDGADVVRTKVFYKNLVRRVDGEDKKFKVFVDWGASYFGDYVMYGSPLQVLATAGLVPQGGPTDIPLLTEEEELIHTSFPTEGQVQATLTTGPAHYKPGVNL